MDVTLLALPFVTHRSIFWSYGQEARLHSRIPQPHHIHSLFLWMMWSSASPLSHPVLQCPYMKAVITLMSWAPCRIPFCLHCQNMSREGVSDPGWSPYQWLLVPRSRDNQSPCSRLANSLRLPCRPEPMLPFPSMVVLPVCLTFPSWSCFLAFPIFSGSTAQLQTKISLQKFWNQKHFHDRTVPLGMTWPGPY